MGNIENNKIILVLFIIFCVVFIMSLFIGRFNISFLSIFNGLEGLEWSVFYYIRLPRLILVTAVGASLSLAGSSYQSIFRNPLVSPDILGVSAGASFGAALAMLLPINSFFIVYIFAFIFGILAVLISYIISRFGRARMVMMMVLAGIVVSSLFNSFISILKYLADPYEKLPGIVFWLMGGFNRTGWKEVIFTIPFILTGIFSLLLMRWYLNVLSLGDEEAISMGINVRRTRMTIVAVTTMMVSASVATVGQVSWIGLVVPHITRYLVGANHRYMIPASVLMGSILLLFMDNVARALTSAEIPISIVTSLIGAPFFAYLLMSKEGSGWNNA